MCHPSSISPRVGTTKKRCRPALGTVFLCCVLALSACCRSRVDAFATLTSTARRSLPALASPGSFDALDAKGLKRGRRDACDELLGMETSRCDGACCWMSTGALAPPREFRRGRNFRILMCAHGGWRGSVGRRSTAVGSSVPLADATRAVDAEFSNAGSGRRDARNSADGEVSTVDEAAEERARTGGQRGRRAGKGSASGTSSTGGGGGGGGGGKLPLPFFDVESVGLKGRWEEMGGNFLLRPPNGQAPKALLHFLGGAFVGAAPHLTYNYLLSGLAEMGFLVVATPYPLGFDYLDVCDGILDRFEQAAVPLAAEYGALPVVGIGHSCGALLQLLITCLFPDTPRAANALISFNNRPVSDAVPGFEDLILPLVMQVLKEGGGKSTLSSTLEMLRETVDNLVDGVAESRFAPAVLENEVIPLVRQVLQITDQLPALFQQIADGTREFTPSPEETRDVVAKMYRARRTIMVRFENDSIDESEGMKDVIQEGKTLLRMRRPLVDMELRYEIIKGNHITPLTQNVFLSTPLDSIDPLFGVRQSAKKEFLKTVNHLGQILVDWLEESAPPVPPTGAGPAASASPASVGAGPVPGVSGAGGV